MTLSMLWPIALIVFSNIFYNICAKETPAGINPFAALSVTYLVGALFSALLYFALNKDTYLLQEYVHLNWTSFVLGLAGVGLEAGSIYMYKAGWEMSRGQLVYSILLALCLILIGVTVYHESLDTSRIIGVILCMAGLILLR